MTLFMPDLHATEEELILHFYGERMPVLGGSGDTKPASRLPSRSNAAKQKGRPRAAFFICRIFF